MGKILVILAIASGCITSGEDLGDFQSRVRNAMAASLDKQKASVQKQSNSVQQIARKDAATVAAPDFYTVPWPAPVNMNVALAATTDCDPLSRSELDSLVTAAALREGVKTDLIHAVIRKESAAKPCVISAKGAQGLMQLMPETAGQLGVLDAFDPKQNVEGGTKLLKQLLTRYNGDLALTLGAYNAGTGNVDRAGGVPEFPETINYVSDILKQMSKQ